MSISKKSVEKEALGKEEASLQIPKAEVPRKFGKRKVKMSSLRKRKKIS
jgi:hypothetical protein